MIPTDIEVNATSIGMTVSVHKCLENIEEWPKGVPPKAQRNYKKGDIWIFISGSFFNIAKMINF